ncbi:dihydroxyacetone kinase subunit DhaL [Manganibacter manganicus]|uniref:Dihydroxyacetone kinase subunit L n=1 Tax=Manganibacter manganicus TaxID=1873176 RepID=A0A1V8RMG8_9HYPH|nr:dihydroxyacetone kinase subunit DhaL [Pseudaminobacter manganicus]OQM74388.1 dihydroxyacetone kinase subunit L [Pseudaminobacter manganicus]
MSARTKKIMNAPEDIIPQMIEGMIGAHPDLLRVAGAAGRAIVAIDGPRPGKVGVVVGGGSGHEPAFAGYVGRGLADAAAVGNVFASPSPELILDAAREADGGAGVVFLYGNYSGDVMNFDMAAEELSASGVAVKSVAVTDDVASAPKERIGERRGIAGDFFVFKIAGAAADRMLPLDEIDRLARHANASTRSMGVALSACSLPQTRKLNFEISADDMEIGMGLHGEPGIRRGPLETADEIAQDLLSAIIADLGLRRGDEVAVLVNGLGSTSMMELYLLHRKTQHILSDHGIAVARSWVGEYATSLEMAGASITVLRLDDELRALLAHPCRSVALTVGEIAAANPARANVAHTAVQTRGDDADGAAEHKELATDGDVTPAIFRQMMRKVGAAIIAEKDWLSQLDGVIGDGDHGVTMEIGWIAVAKALAAAPDHETIEATCKRMAKAFLDAVGASSGPLYATAFLRAGTAVGDRRNLDANALASWIAAACQGIRDRGRSEPGDKTMVDAWVPAAVAATNAAQNGASSVEVMVKAAAGAKDGMDRTTDMVARRGRSAKLGERSIGHIDPGAASTYLTLRAMTEALQGALGQKAPGQ